MKNKEKLDELCDDALRGALQNWLRLNLDPEAQRAFAEKVRADEDNAKRIVKAYDTIKGTVETDTDADNIGLLFLHGIVDLLPNISVTETTQLTMMVKLLAQIVAWHTQRKNINRDIAAAVLLGQPQEENEEKDNDDNPDTSR